MCIPKLQATWGVKATVDKLLRAGINRPNLQREVKYVADRCGFCQKFANRRQDDGKSQPKFNEIMEVGEEWSLDTIGPLRVPADESAGPAAPACHGRNRWVLKVCGEPASEVLGLGCERGIFFGEIFIDHWQAT